MADFGKFFIISGIGWLLDVVLTMGLVQLGYGPFVASLVGAGTAVTFVYIVSLFAVFNVGRIGGLRGYAFYVLWQIFAIAVASALVSFISYLLEPLLEELVNEHAGGISAYFPTALSLASGLAKFIVTPLTLIANFLFMRWLTASLHVSYGASRRE